MNVCLINGGFDTRLTSPEQLLDRYWHVPQLAAALTAQGHAVTAIQAFHRNEQVHNGGVAFEFVKIASRRNREWNEVSRFDDIARKLESCRPDVVHVFGLTLLPLCRAAGHWCVQHGVGLTSSFHGGHPARNPFRRWRQRRALSRSSAFFFSNECAAEEWRGAGMLPDGAQISLAPEVSSPFAGIPKDAARQALGISGNPVLVWAGRLHPMKDPMMVLQGLRLIARAWPDVQLLMAYQSEELLPEIEAFLAGNPALGKRVTLLGALEHSKMETLFSAADFFVHSSHREHGSNVLVEALSCGAIPVVSEIPSLRALTEHIGPSLTFPVGDAAALARGMLEFQLPDIDGLAEQVRSAFNAHLSYRALAVQYSAVFDSLVERQVARSRK